MISMAPKPTSKPIPGFSEIAAIQIYGDWRVVDLVAAREDSDSPWLPKYAIGEIHTAYRDLCAWASVNYQGQYN